MKTQYLFIAILFLIFSCNKKEEAYFSEISGTVYDSLSMSVIQNGTINLVEKAKPFVIITSINTDAIGNYKLSQVEPFVDYYLICTKNDYASKNISINLNPGELKEKCDLYLIKSYAEITGTLYDTSNLSIIKNGKILLVEKANPSIIVDSTNTNETGTFYFAKAKPLTDYNLICKKENYKSKTISLKLNAGEQLLCPVYLNKSFINISKPQKTTHWTVGSTATIQWTDDFSGNVKIELFKAGIFELLIVANTTANSSYIWTIPSDLESLRIDYTIKITSLLNPENYGISDNFAIERVVNDIDWNAYNTVTIGTQVWLRENLAVTHYNNGTKIPIEDTKSIMLSDSGAAAWSNSSYIWAGVIYGALYNWYAVNTGILCPPGWHVPSVAEWNKLITYVGGESYAADKLKEAGYAHWFNQIQTANNESGFTALPAGVCQPLLDPYGINSTGNWWSANQYGGDFAWSIKMEGKFSYITKDPRTDKTFGLSVRCLMD